MTIVILKVCQVNDLVKQFDQYPKKEVGHVILGDMPHLNFTSIRQANDVRREGCLRFNLFCLISLEKTLQIFGGASHIQENEPQFSLSSGQYCQYGIFPNCA